MSASSQQVTAGRAVTVVADHLSTENIRWLVAQFDHPGRLASWRLAELVKWAFDDGTDDGRAMGAGISSIVSRWPRISFDAQYELFGWARELEDHPELTMPKARDYRPQATAPKSPRVRGALRLVIDNGGVR